MMKEILQFFFPADQLIAVVVNLLIAAILAVSLLVLYRNGYLRIRSEKRYLQLLKRAVQDEDKEDLKQTVARFEHNAIVRERVESLETLERVGDEIDHEALAAVANSRLENSIRLASWSSYGVVLLGFAGTLVGLTRSVEGASESLRELGEAATIDQATRPLMETLGGIHVAFSTTLAGVLSALILGAVLAVVQQRQTNFLINLEQLTQDWLIPRYRTSAGVALVNAAQKLTELERHLDQSLRKIIEELETRGGILVSTIEERFKGLVDDFREGSTAHLDHIQSLHERISQHLGEDPDNVPSLSESLGILYQASSIIRDDIHEYRGAFIDFGEAMKATSDRYGRLFNDSIQNQARSLETKLDRIESIFSSENQSTKESLERLEAIVQRIEAQEIAGSQVVDNLIGAAQDLRTAVDRMKQAVLIHQEVAGELTSTLRRQSYLRPATFARQGDVGREDGFSSGDDKRLRSYQIESKNYGEGESVESSKSTHEEGPSRGRGKPSQESKPKNLFERLFGERKR